MITLQNIYQHTDLSKEDLKAIFDSHKIIEFKKGDYLLHEGQIANEYYCLESGLIRSFVYDYNGNDITTDFFVNDEIVIEVVSLFQRVPSKENIQTVTDCVCWKIDFDAFQNLFKSIKGLSEWGRSWMTERLFHCKQRSVSMITDSATDRYLTLQDQYPQIIVQAPLKYIATYIGVTDTSLSRIRREIVKA